MKRAAKRLFFATLVSIIACSMARFASATPTSFSSFDTAVVKAPIGLVYFLYPDWDQTRAYLKAPGVIVAQLSDWSAMGIIYGMGLNTPQQQGLDTSSFLVDTSTGAPLVGSTIVIFSGPVVHSVVHYYETTRIAPIYFFYDQGIATFQFRRAADNTIVASMPETLSRGGHSDLFLLEAFIDQAGRRVFIGYGFDWHGSFAAAKYLKAVIYGPNGQNIGQYLNSWYVFRWSDQNGDGYPDLNEISFITSGN